MNLEVKFQGRYRKIFDTDRTVVQLSDEADVRELLNRLCDQHNCRAQLFDGDRLRPQINIAVNGTFIIRLNWLDTRLSEGDEIRMFDPVTGG